jgi:hypothetical protein
MKNEAQRYVEYAPKTTGNNVSTLHRTAESSHYAANAYILSGLDIENAHSLLELYRVGPEKSFNAVLKNLYENALADWSHGKRILEEKLTLDELYRARLNLTAVREQVLAERVRALVRQMPTLGLTIERNAGERNAGERNAGERNAGERNAGERNTGERNAGTISLRLGAQSSSYPDPAQMIYQKSTVGQPVLLSNTPGMLSGENILTDKSSRVWLTDFTAAGLAPLLWNFVTLEAAIRFDWVALDWDETYKLQWLHEFELALVDGHFSKPDLSEVVAPLRKPLRAIRMIRQLAEEIVGRETLPYHFGMLFHATSRLAEFNPNAPHTSKELTRPAHALIAAAMIGRKIMQTNPGISLPAVAPVSGIRLDGENYVVWVDGEKMPIEGQSYDLLNYLHSYANQLRTRRDIIEHVFRQQYDPDNTAQYELVNTAISRLREKLESDPKRPRYLKTVKGRGYRLDPDPSL